MNSLKKKPETLFQIHNKPLSLNKHIIPNNQYQYVKDFEKKDISKLKLILDIYKL